MEWLAEPWSFQGGFLPYARDASNRERRPVIVEFTAKLGNATTIASATTLSFSSLLYV